MPSLQNKTQAYCISSVECRNSISTAKFHIGGYGNVQKTSLSKFNQEHVYKLQTYCSNMSKQPEII